MNFERHKRIYTLGTSTRSREEFIELLSSHGVEVAVDVRRFPSSRFEHFQRERLAGLLIKAGIDYVYMGEELGGYRRGGYRKHVESNTFKDGVNKLLELARDQNIALMCKEQSDSGCHRRYIVEILRTLGVEAQPLESTKQGYLL